MNKTFFLVLILIILCSSVFAFGLPKGIKTTDFVYSKTGLIYAPMIQRINSNGRIAVKPIAGCFAGKCVSVCESAKIRRLFMWGCN